MTIWKNCKKYPQKTVKNHTGLSPKNGGFDTEEQSFLDIRTKEHRRVKNFGENEWFRQKSAKVRQKKD